MGIFVQRLHSSDIPILRLEYFHTRLQLRIWQVSACKFEPQSGYILYLGPPPPLPHPPTAMLFLQCCAESTPPSICFSLNLTVSSCAVSPPQSGSLPLPHSALSWPLRKDENLARYSWQFPCEVTSFC